MSRLGVKTSLEGEVHSEYLPYGKDTHIEISRKREGMEQELTVILTETEKRTALLGRQFCRLQFARVDLARAVFRKADLEGTGFMLADLHEADFRRANLHGAEFFLCDLYGADFTDACLEKATFHRSVGLSSALRTYIRSHGEHGVGHIGKDLAYGRKLV